MRRSTNIPNVTKINQKIKNYLVSERSKTTNQKSEDTLIYMSSENNRRPFNDE